MTGDVLDRESLEHALAGVDTAYYLVHSMGSGSRFEALEREGALNFAAASKAQGVRRVIYLGGLGDERLSAHMRSRHEVGRILRESGVPTLELRASIVIGSGSLSFEMIRALVERLPAMITPRWVNVVAQPIGIEDLITYLVEARELPLTESRVVEIGGAEQVSYGALMQEYARQRGLRRLMLPVPFLTPRLSSLWLGLVTPLYARIGRTLIDSIKAFPLIYVLTSGGPGTATQVTNYYAFTQAFNYAYWGYASAIAVMLTAGVFALSWLVSAVGTRSSAHD